MIQKNQKWDKTLNFLYEEGEKEYTVREISKKSQVPSATVQRYLDYLKKKNIVDNKNRLIVNTYTKFLKSEFILNKMFKSGLFDYIEEELNASCLIVFGSVRKGDYVKESDVDIFVETTKKKELNLSKFEKIIGHNIQLFIEKDVKKLPDHLFNNVINGIKVGGYLKLR